MPSDSERQRVASVGHGLCGAVEKAVKGITLALHDELSEHTPNHADRAATEWVPVVGRPQQETVGRLGAPGVASSRAVAERGRVAVAGYRLAPGRVSLTGGVLYIARLNDGRSAQEPRSFVQRGIAETVRKTRT